MKLVFRILIFTLISQIELIAAQVSFENSKLIVLIEEPNKKIEEKLDPNELALYHKEIEQYNEYLKKCIDLYWKLSLKAVFVSKSQLEKIIETKALNTLYLVNSKYSFNYADFSSYKLSNKLHQSKDAVVENYNKKQLPYRANSIEIKRADLPVTSPSVATAVMLSIKQNEAELIYAIKSLALQIDYRNKGTTEVQLMKMYIKNAPHLKDLTLLVNKSELDEAAQNNFANHYKFAYQLADKAAIDYAILNADKTKAIALVFPNTDGSFAFKVFDASTMEILGQTGTIPPSEYYPELNNKIKPNHLEEFTHYCD
jgi:hypothetical protein